MRPKGLPKTGGRKKGTLNRVTYDIQKLARQYTERALLTLAGIMERGESEAARVSAANALLDRGHGRPKQAVEISNKSGEDFRLKHTHVLNEIDSALARIAAGAKPPRDPGEPDD
jgi:hypothetical protein